MDFLKIRDSVKLARPLSGCYRVEQWRDGVCIRIWEGPNSITIEGKNFLLDTMFHASTACTTWYLSLIDSVGYTALDEGDTYDNINQAGNQWDEFETYEFGGDGTKRVPYVEAAAAAKSITNSANVGVFDILGAGTVKGIFLCGQPVGGGATPADQGDHHADGILWSTIFFTTGDAAVLNGDQLKITYTVST